MSVLPRLAICLSVCLLAAPLPAQEPKVAIDSVPPLRLPNDADAAVEQLKGWLTAQKLEAESNERLVTYRHNNVLVNIQPSVYEGELDRLIVSAYYSPTDEFKGTQALYGLAADRNAAQNLLRVHIDQDGDFAVTGNMTFFDEFSAAEYHSFMNLYATVVREHVLDEAALKMLK